MSTSEGTGASATGITTGTSGTSGDGAGYRAVARSTPRLSADERRAELVDAAIEAFAVSGLQGTAVSTITNAVGITQPYAFSLFGSKKGLFLAAVERCMERLETLFSEAVANSGATDGQERLRALGAAYTDLTATQPSLLHLQLQAFAASGSDADVREVVSRRMQRIFELAGQLTGVDHRGVRQFLGQGLLCTLGDVLNLDALLPDADDRRTNGGAGVSPPTSCPVARTSD